MRMWWDTVIFSPRARDVFCSLISLILQLNFSVENYSFFDPIGFGTLNRSNRSTIERNIRALHKELNSVSVASNSSNDNHLQGDKRKSNSIQAFLSTVGKSEPRVKSGGTHLNIADDLSVYRSLALREHNDIVEKGKEHNVFAFWLAHQGQLRSLAYLAQKHLITRVTSVPSASALSVASFLGHNERSRLNPQSLAQLVFLKDKMEDGTWGCEGVWGWGVRESAREPALHTITQPPPS